MDLLMGENLYRDPYIFVRELLQNALDTSRHRSFIERAQGNDDFQPKPIQVHHWIDQDGYQWVRFDDQGMGMSEEIVRNHLLKVGSSYYRTAGFRAEILRAGSKKQEEFVPISRFGIGLLSCFIAGDRVEISTLRQGRGGEAGEPIRLSLNGIYGFFILQTPHLPPRPMPGPNQEETGYRSEPGTAIAVRLDPRKENGSFDPEALLKYYVACPPVPIEFDGARLGGDPAVLVDRPWCERTTVTLTPSDMKTIGEIAGEELQRPLQVEFLPIDLTRHSPVPQLKGQIVIATIVNAIELQSVGARANLSLIPGHLSSNLDLQIEFRNSKAFSMPISLPSGVQKLWRSQDRKHAWLSHNGITVPAKGQVLNRQGDSESAWILGIVALADSLRPELSVSREELLGLPWQFYSAMGLALYRALADLDKDLISNPWSLLRMYNPRSISLRELLEDESLHIGGPWAHLPIIRTASGLRSLQEIRESVSHGAIEILGWNPEERNYLSWCASTLIQRGLNVSVHFAAPLNARKIVATQGDPIPITEGHKFFPPLTFLPFNQAHPLRITMGSIILNSQHPFSVWLLEKAPEIAKRYPGMFDRIKAHLMTSTSWSTPAAYAVEGLNTALERLRELHPSVRPPKKLTLKTYGFD